MLIARFSSRLNLHTQLSQWSTNYRVTIAVRGYPSQRSLNKSPSTNYRVTIVVRVYPNHSSLNDSSCGSHFLNAHSLPTLSSKGEFVKTNSKRGPIGLNALFYVMLYPKGEIFNELTEGCHCLSALFTLSYPPKESCLKELNLVSH